MNAIMQIRGPWQYYVDLYLPCGRGRTATSDWIFDLCNEAKLPRSKSNIGYYAIKDCFVTSFDAFGLDFEHLHSTIVGALLVKLHPLNFRNPEEICNRLGLPDSLGTMLRRSSDRCEDIDSLATATFQYDKLGSRKNWSSMRSKR